MRNRLGIDGIWPHEIFACKWITIWSKWWASCLMMIDPYPPKNGEIRYHQPQKLMSLWTFEGYYKAIPKGYDIFQASIFMEHFHPPTLKKVVVKMVKDFHGDL